MLPLKKLVDSGTIRIIDLVVLHKDGDGTVTTVELEGLDPDEAALFSDLDGDVMGLLNEEDIAFAGAALAPGNSAAILVWEDLWVSGFARDVEDAGGQVVGHDAAARGPSETGHPDRGRVRGAEGQDPRQLTPGSSPARSGYAAASRLSTVDAG